MRLLSTLAHRIVREVTAVVKEEVIVVDEEGIIIAASDATRVGSYHEGATYAISRKDMYVISEEDVSRLKGVKAGINLPIFFHQHVVGVIGITGEPSKVIQFGQLIQRMTELIIQEAYSSERLESKNRSMESFVYEWVHLHETDRGFIERGEILGISMDLPRQCLYMEVADDPVLERKVLDYVSLFFQEDNQNFVIRWGNGRFVILLHYPWTSDDKLRLMLQQCIQSMKEKMQTEVFVGVGTKKLKPNELHETYQEARKAIQVAKKKHIVVYYEDLTLDIALTELSTMTKNNFVRRVLGRIKTDQELLETISTYLDCNGSIKETADNLHIHINTLHYRLNRIHEITGMSLKKTEHRVCFYLALEMFDSDVE
ncbi:CdaR family transcriptional regulator [Evansella sp. AB-rgal1]|uniref:CdaR family transcriptional regulator n=1 Tax=Evansella sp. AB-rgal1 TaxID=3242696 RepID=UPI00359D1153